MPTPARPRLDKSARLLELARLLAASAEGMTLDEMAEAIGVGRRTAERMRDAIGSLFESALQDDQDGASKRFRIVGGLDGFLQAPDVVELAELEIARRRALQQGNASGAAALGRIATKIQAALKSSAKARIAPDLEALMRAEAVAVQPGPRPMEDPEVLGALRQALLGLNQISMVYRGGRNAGTRRTLVPYGLIFGEETYLAAMEVNKPPEPRPRMYRLDQIETLDVLDIIEGPPPSFNLEAFAARSFGVYQTEPEDIVLHVLPHNAAQIARYRFHPAQKVETQADGSLLVSMRAGGLRELAWKLFRWRDDIRIIASENLKKEMREGLTLAAAQLEPLP